MNKTIEEVAGMICFTIFFIAMLIAIIVVNNNDEKIKLLEQSLNEQLQEKEVYMRMVNEVK